MSCGFKSLCFSELGQDSKQFESTFNPTNVVKITAKDSSGLKLETLSKLKKGEEGWTANTILSSGFNVKEQAKISASYTSEKRAFINVTSSQKWREDLVLSLIARTKPITIIPSVAYENKSFTLAATGDAVDHKLTISTGSSFSSFGFEYKISQDFVLISAVKELGKNFDFSLWTKLSPSLSISLQASLEVPTKKIELQGLLASSINKKTKLSAGFHSSGKIGLSISVQVYNHIELSFTGLFDVFQARDFSTHKFGMGLNINTLY